MRLERVRDVIRKCREREEPRSQLGLYSAEEIMLYSAGSEAP